MKPAATRKISVELSEAQAELFQRAADCYGANVGDVILAFACTHITANPVCEYADMEVCAALWDYVAQRIVPTPDANWNCFAPERAAEGGIA